MDLDVGDGCLLLVDEPEADDESRFEVVVEVLIIFGGWLDVRQDVRAFRDGFVDVYRFFALVDGRIEHVFVTLCSDAIRRGMIMGGLGMIVCSYFSYRLRTVAFFVCFRAVRLYILRILNELFRDGPMIVCDDYVCEQEGVEGGEDVVCVGYAVFRITRACVGFTGLLRLDARVVQDFGCYFVRDDDRERDIFYAIVDLRRRVILHSNVVGVFVASGIVERCPCYVFEDNSDRCALGQGDVLGQRFYVRVNEIRRIR